MPDVSYGNKTQELSQSTNFLLFIIHIFLFEQTHTDQFVQFTIHKLQCKKDKYHVSVIN